LELLIDRTLAFATVIGVGFLLLVSLAVNAALSAFGKRYHGWLSTPEYVLQSLDFIISYVVIAFLFALIYKLLPDLRLEWRDVIPGALVTSFLFSTGKLVIGMYLGKASLASTYGAAGSLVIVLVWVYYSAQIFFLGAEFTQAYAERFGSRPCDRARIEVKVASNTDAPEQVVHSSPGESLVRLP
jgi:membrane protein